MNKKGFTLIEMLAVVVLLGLLFAILFPAISKYIINTKNSTYEMYEADMKTSTQNMMNDCLEANDTLCLPEKGKYKKVTLSQLIASGYSEKLRDPEDDSKECDPFESFVLVESKKTNITNLKYEVCLVCGKYKSGRCEEIKDFEPIPRPECTVDKDKEPPECGSTQGESKIWTNKDRTITVGCSDKCSGCTQDTFTKKFTEDTRRGSITISDKAEKTADCEVDVYVDKTKPTCTLEVQGTIGEHGWYKADPRPRVVMTSKDDTTSGVATYGMGTSRSNYDFNKETSFEVPDGITTVYGYVKDNAGNVGTCYVEVPYDPNPPVIKSVDYGTIVYGTGNNSKPDMLKSKSGKTIKINNITSEYGDIYGVYIYMASGKGGTVTITDESTNKSLATVTVTTAKSKERNFFAKSKVGSYSSLVFTFGSEEQVNNVTRIELLTRDDTVGYYTNKDVTLYINASDSVSGRGQYSFDDGAHWQDNNDKTYTKLTTVSMRVKDYSGNVSLPATVRKITNIDKVVPQCVITFGKNLEIHDNGYYWANVPVALTKDDSVKTDDYASSGTRNYGLKNSSGLEYNGENSGIQTKDTTGHTWYGYVRDNAGNTKDCNNVVKKDTQDPECSLVLKGTPGDNNWYKETNVDVEFEYYRDKEKDGSKSGRATWDITASATPSYSNSTKKTQSSNTTSDGITYHGYIKDKAGRTATCTKWFRLDKTQPYCKLTTSGTPGDNDWYTSNVSISFVNSETGDDLSGTQAYGIGSYTGSKTATHKEDTQSVTYTGYIKDNAGNTKTCSVKFKRDASAPSCTPGKDHTYHSNGVTTKASCGDDISGVVTASFADEYQTSSKKYTCENGAGLTSSCTVPVTSGPMNQKRVCSQYNYGGPSSSVCGTESCNCQEILVRGYPGSTAWDDCANACDGVCSCQDTGTSHSNTPYTQFCCCDTNGGCEWKEVCSTCAKSCYSNSWGCHTWGDWSGTGTYYPTSSCTYVYGDTECNSATVYW